MFELIPAILPGSLKDIEDHLLLLERQVPVVQIDVVDGIFAPEVSWPYTPQGKEEFADVLSHTQHLPYWKEYAFEVDLMVTDSVQRASAWAEAGASRIIIHATSPDAYDALLYLQSNKGGDHPVSVGMALPISAHPETLEEFEGLFNYVQVMGIAHVGKQGEAFDSRALSLLSSLHALYPDMPLQIDGGVGIKTIPSLREAGATRFVAGSAIFNEENPQTALKLLSEAIHS